MRLRIKPAPSAQSGRASSAAACKQAIRWRSARSRRSVCAFKSASSSTNGASASTCIAAQPDVYVAAAGHYGEPLGLGPVVEGARQLIGYALDPELWRDEGAVGIYGLGIEPAVTQPGLLAIHHTDELLLVGLMN